MPRAQTQRILPKTVTVMLGGTSAEREVSLRTGIAVARALRSLGHTVLELDPPGDQWELPPQTEVVFLALHGTYGEDGGVQQRLESLGVPYTGCDAEASRLAFDKVATKERLVQAGLLTPRFLTLEGPGHPWPEGWDPPLVLKPACQGSSVGLSFVPDRAVWAHALEETARFGDRVLVEEQIQGRELTVGILAGAPLPLVEIRPRSGAYDYRNKYTTGATEYLVPAPLEGAVTARVQRAGLEAFQAIGGRDYARVDLLLEGGERPMILEVNTLPGMTETSLLPKAAEAAGYDYARLCQTMIDLALAHDPPRSMPLRS